MLGTEDLQIALQELETVRQREAIALRDSRATFAVLDALIAAPTTEAALTALLEVVAKEFDVPFCALCRAGTDGSPTRILRQTGTLRLSESCITAGLSLLDRPRRMTSLAALAPPETLAPMQSAILVPLPLPGEPGLALLCLSDQPAWFRHTDLMRLLQMGRVAIQPLTALRLARRNAELVALLGGTAVETSPLVDPSDEAFDLAFQAVNQAVDRLTRAQGQAVLILNRVLTAEQWELDQAIAEALALMGQQCGADRAYVFEVTAPHRTSNTYEWVSDGTAPMKDQLQDLPLDIFPHWLEQLQAGMDVYVPDVAALPEGAPEKAFLGMQGIQSLVISPILDHGVMDGFIGYDAVRQARQFLPGEVFLLRAVSNAIGAMLRKRRSDLRDRQAQQALDLERARLRATLDALPDLVIELDASGRFCENYSHSNSIMLRIASQLLGRTLDECMPTDLAQACHRMLSEVAAHGCAEGHSFAFDVPDHGTRWIRANATRREPAVPGGQHGFLFVFRDVTTEVEQAREIALLGEIAKRTSNLVVVTDTKARVTWVNEAFEKVSGWTLAEIRGRNPGELLQTPDVDQAAVARIRAAIRDGRPIKEELSNVSRTGRRYWITLDIQPLRSADGNLVGFMAVETDITDAKMQAGALAAAAEAARRTRTQLIAAVEALEDGFVYFDKTGGMVVCNERYRKFAPGFEDILVPGVTLEQILRRGLVLGIYPDAIGREESWLEKRLAAQNSKPVVTLEQRLSDGRWVRIFDKRTPDGGRVGLRIDITALKNAEARALSDRAAAMDAAHDGMAITAANGTLLYANQAFAEITRSHAAVSTLGRHWSDAVGPEAAADLTARAMPTLRKLGDRWRGIVEARLIDDSKADLEISLSQRGDGALVWVVRDLTERRAAEVEHNRLREALQTAQRREVIGQLAAGLAHDFNNLIAAISGSATLILEDDGDSAAQRAKSHASRIQKSAERAEDMVRRLLALGARPSRHQQTDLVAVLREASDLLRPGLGQSVRLTVDLPDQPVMSGLEPTDLLQIVLNLGINARDAMLQTRRPNQPCDITLRLRPAEPIDLAPVQPGRFRLGMPDPSRSYACLVIADTGPGIALDQAESIFAPYFSTKGEKGSGLGLPIVAGVIKAAGGSIELARNEPSGAVFTILLPLSGPEPWVAEATGGPPASALSPSADGSALPAEPPMQPPPPPRQKAQPLLGRSILIVDDAEDVLWVLAALLERAGAEVAPTCDPEAAHEVLREDPDAFDLVITDFDMGPLTGADLARAVHHVRPDLPVILVTALPDWRVRDAQGAEDPAFFSVLGKPVSVEALVGAALAALDSRQN